MNQLTKINITVDQRIYVACLASYNSGILHGKWIELNQDCDDVKSEIQELLKSSPIKNSEEWAIHDYEGFGSYSVSEYEDLEGLLSLSEMIQKCGEAYTVLVDYMGGIDSTSEELFDEVYQGEWNSEVEFTENFADEIMEIPENIQFYFDYEKFSRDLFINDYWSFESSNGVHVFRRY